MDPNVKGISQSPASLPNNSMYLIILCNLLSGQLYSNKYLYLRNEIFNELECCSALLSVIQCCSVSLNYIKISIKNKEKER